MIRPHAQPARVPASRRDETQAALIDLLRAGAVDVRDQYERLTPERAEAFVRADSSWTESGEISVVQNDRSIDFRRHAG